ncbi:MAG: MarR family transcriptional regulator [Ignavibacteria bacterium]|jgi:MarR family 2-MHQ and catechol resistance regulon transcriptional repressor
MSSKYKGSGKEVVALNTYIKLTRATDSVNSLINNLLKKEGLTDSQFRVMDALFHLGPLTQKSLGEKILKSGGNVNLVIDNLEKRKLVKRKRGSKDRRYYIVELTKKGQVQTKGILPKIVDLISDSLNILSKADQKTLQIMLKKIGLKQK